MKVEITKQSDPKPDPELSAKPDVQEPAPESEEEDYEINDLLKSDPNFKYLPLDFKSPLEMLYTISPNFLSGTMNLYSWQAEKLDYFGNKFTASCPMKFLLCAANGSGKDAFINAPLALWFVLHKVRSRVVITSSSYTQLQAQTENYIASLAREANQWMLDNGLEESLVIKKEHIVNRLTKSEIKMFVTDDPGRAEGYHPFPDYPGAEMCIIVNEAKSVPDNIFGALKRCTGFNYWLEISSPGRTSGHFFNVYKNALNWEERNKAKGRYFRDKITAYDCPGHISEAEIEDAKIELGEFSPLFRSIYLAEFTSIDEPVVVKQEALEKAKNFPPEHIPGRISAGVDLAAGGDENGMVLVNGNKMVDEYFFRDNNTMSAAQKIADKLVSWKLVFGLKEENIFADDGGVGKAILDHVVFVLGVMLVRMLNQAKPLNKLRYANRGSELWFTLARMIEENLLVLNTSNTKLMDQLANRYYRQQSNGRLILESKREARAKGHPSPDRADALVLAFTGISIEDMLEAKTKGVSAGKGDSKPRGHMMYTREELEEYMLEYGPEKTKRLSATGMVNNSMSVAVKLLNN